MDEPSPNKNQEVKVYLLNKKEDIDREKSLSGMDLYKEEVDSLIKVIQDSRELIYERRAKIKGVGIVYAEGKFLGLFDEAVDAYKLGLYYSTVALCSMAAERICYDYLDLSVIIMRGKVLSLESKAELYFLPLARLINFLYHAGVIDEKSKVVLHEINEARNKHIHPKMSSDVKKDALDVLNLLCEAIENLLSIFRDYDLENGKLKRKQEGE